MVTPGDSARARRALQRQLAYQEKKSRTIQGSEKEFIEAMRQRSSLLRSLLEAVRPLASEDRVLEVGSGAHGLIFFLGLPHAVGCDPLAREYARLFPAWQTAATTIAARGETLPFADATFHVVLCDNVVDHAEDPLAIAGELVRVLRPGGVLFFTVNVHHRAYDIVSRLHGAWNAAGLRLEIGPFANHTVHLTPAAARHLFANRPIDVMAEHYDVEAARKRARRFLFRDPRNVLRAIFYKNVRFELIAVRRG